MDVHQNASNPNSTFPAFWSGEKIAAITLLCVMTPFIVLGNLLVIISVAKCRQLKSTTNYYLVSLAIADICTGLFAPLFIAEELLKDHISSSLMCLGPHCLLMTTCGVSVLSLAAIAYDRYTALTRTLEYLSIMTFRKMMTFTVFAWIYSALIAWLPLMKLYDVDAPCSFHIIRREPILVLLTCVFLPAYLVIITCYARIFCIARHHAGAIAAVQTSIHRQIEANFVAKGTKYAKTLAIVVGFFVLLWLPYQLCLMIEFFTDIEIDDWVRDFLALLSYFNSGINPWIYSLRNPDFKRAFIDIIIDCLSSCGLTHDWYNDDPGTISSYLKARAAAYGSRNGSYGGCTPWNSESRRSSGARQGSIVAETATQHTKSPLALPLPRPASVPLLIPPTITVDLCDGGGSPISENCALNFNNNCNQINDPRFLSVPCV